MEGEKIQVVWLNAETIDLPSGDYDTGNDSEYVFDSCPFCYAEKKFSWNVNDDHGHCWVCEEKVVGHWYLKQVLCAEKTELFKVSKRPKSRWKSPKRVEEEKDYFYSPAWDNNDCRTFLRNRNLNERMCNEVPILYSAEGRCMGITVNGTSPELRDSMLWRSPTRKMKWFAPRKESMKNYGFNLKRFETGEKLGVILMEGIFDVLSPGLLDHAIAMCGSKLDNSWYAWFNEYISRVAIWLDPDLAGRIAGFEIDEVLTTKGIDHKIFYGKKPPKHYRWWCKEDKEFLEDVLAYTQQ